jgi:hypothetical protein
MLVPAMQSIGTSHFFEYLDHADVRAAFLARRRRAPDRCVGGAGVAVICSGAVAVSSARDGSRAETQDQNTVRTQLRRFDLTDKRATLGLPDSCASSHRNSDSHAHTP